MMFCSYGLYTMISIASEHQPFFHLELSPIEYKRDDIDLIRYEVFRVNQGEEAM